MIKDISDYFEINEKGNWENKIILVEKKKASKEVLEKLLKIKWWNLPHYFFKQKKVIKIFSKEIDFDLVKTLEKMVIDFENKL